jgi:2-keto-4-pentenoate hydratase
LWHLWSHGLRLQSWPPELVPSDFDDAWLLQRELDALAAPRVGWKLSAVSSRAQAEIGIDHPIMGPLYQRQLVPNFAAIGSTSMGIVEAEVAIVLGDDISSALSPLTRTTLLPHIKAVHSAFEIPEMRMGTYPDVTAIQLVADFMAAGYFILGPELVEADLSDLSKVEVRLAKGGVLQASGVARGALGDPVDAMVWLANELLRRGESLRGGDIVTTGACAWIHGVAEGDAVSATFDGSAEVVTAIRPE